MKAGNKSKSRMRVGLGRTRLTRHEEDDHDDVNDEELSRRSRLWNYQSTDKGSYTRKGSMTIEPSAKMRTKTTMSKQITMMTMTDTIRDDEMSMKRTATR